MAAGEALAPVNGRKCAPACYARYFTQTPCTLPQVWCTIRACCDRCEFFSNCGRVWTMITIAVRGTTLNAGDQRQVSIFSLNIQIDMHNYDTTGKMRRLGKRTHSMPGTSPRVAGPLSGAVGPHSWKKSGRRRPAWCKGQGIFPMPIFD